MSISFSKIAITFLLVILTFFILTTSPYLWAANKASKPVQQVTLNTSYGDITLELDTENAPITTENFLSYVTEGHYDGTIFHRVIDGFMIQGGGFSEDFKEKPTKDSIKNEANNGLKNNAYTVAMARISDPHSASAQFFINVTNNDGLNYKNDTVAGYGYAVFGKVISGQDVVDKIKAVETSTVSYHSDVPKEAIIIKKAFIVEQN